MYDVTKLKSLAECRTVMQRARDRNLPDVYEAVFRRMCQLVGSENDEPSDPLVKDFYETLAAYEQLLTERTRKLRRPITPAERYRTRASTNHSSNGRAIRPRPMGSSFLSRQDCPSTRVNIWLRAILSARPERIVVMRPADELPHRLVRRRGQEVPG
jgi:hypothetical protein